MGKKVRILAFSGSLREKSINKQILKVAAEGAEEAGGEVTVIDLADYQLPIYNQEIQDGGEFPENALKLKKLFWDHDGLLIASPEYNSSVSAALKNTIDWVSRTSSSDEKPLSCFAGKMAAIISASPGNLGGIRGLFHLREILQNIQVTVLPKMKSIANVDLGNSDFISDKDAKALKAVGKNLSESL